MIITSLPLRNWLRYIERQDISRVWLPWEIVKCQFQAAFNHWSRGDVLAVLRGGREYYDSKKREWKTVSYGFQTNNSKWKYLNLFKWFEVTYALIDAVVSRGILTLIALVGVPSYLIAKGLFFLKEVFSNYKNSGFMGDVASFIAIFLSCIEVVMSAVTAAIHGVFTLAYLPVLLGLNFLRSLVNAITSPIETYKEVLNAFYFKHDSRVALLISALCGGGLGVVVCLLLPMTLPLYLSGALVGCAMYIAMPAIQSTISEFEAIWKWLEKTHEISRREAYFNWNFLEAEACFPEFNIDPRLVRDVHFVMAVQPRLPVSNEDYNQDGNEEDFDNLRGGQLDSPGNNH